jgi:hypothetical protein
LRDQSWEIELLILDPVFEPRKEYGTLRSLSKSLLLSAGRDERRPVC